MLRNLPNKYTRDRLLDQLHAGGFQGEIDFLYLPIDFKNKCNVGYAFLNFRSWEACARFFASYHNMDSREMLPGFNSKKVLQISPARVQGLAPNVQRLRSSQVMRQIIDRPDWMPVLLDEWGRHLPFYPPEADCLT
jgi:hypothetical protein